jgi:hypothetical protein
MADQSKPAMAGEKTVTGHDPASTESLRAPDEVKKKRRYSRRMRGGQEVERGVSKAAASLGDAVAATFNSYKKSDNKSSFKKRDGAVKDAMKNWTKATSKGMKKASDAPYQVVKAVNTSKASKQIRDAVKMFSPPMFR